jgi:TP901 family phage tail tape measure protein
VLLADNQHPTTTVGQKIMGFNLSEGFIDLTVHEAKFNSVMGRVRGILSGVSSKMEAVSRTAKRMFLAAAAYSGVSLKAYGSFEAAMRKATAVSEVSDRQFTKMSRMAEEQAIRLNMAATKTADAFYYLGSAGLSVSEQIKAYVPVATLAKAATIEMGAAAEMVVDTMKGFQTGFENTAHVTDVMAKSVTSSNMTFSQLGETLSLVSGVARSTNNSLEQTVAMIATMADVGLKGSMAGTSLRRALLNIAAPTSAINQMLKRYGIEVYDANGKMKPFIQLVGEISEKLKGASEAERNMAFRVMFGARAIAGQIAIFNKGREALKEYAQGLKDSGGTAENIAKKQMGFSEMVGQTWQRIKRLSVHIGEILAPAFLKLSNKLGEVTDKLTKFIDKHKLDIQEWGERMAARIAAITNIVEGFVKFMTTDFWTGAKWGLDAVLKEFQVFGQSLMMIMEKIFTDLYNNVGVWVRRAMARREMYKETMLAVEDMLSKQYFKTHSKLMGVPAETREEWSRAAEDLARRRLAAVEKAGGFKARYPLKEATTWEEVGKKILEIQKKALEVISKTAPPAFVDLYKKEWLENLPKKLAEIEERYAKLRLGDIEETNEKIAKKLIKTEAPPFIAPTMERPAYKFGFVDVASAWKSLVAGISARAGEDEAKRTADATERAAKATEQIADLTRKSTDYLESMAEDFGDELAASNLGTVGP